MAVETMLSFYFLMRTAIQRLQQINKKKNKRTTITAAITTKIQNGDFYGCILMNGQDKH